MKFEYKELNSYERRFAEAQRMRHHYNDRVPVVVEKWPKAKFPPLQKCKFLLPQDLTLGQFYFLVRKRIELRPEEALFFFVGDRIPPSSTTLEELYENYRDEDGFLYIAISDENVYG